MIQRPRYGVSKRIHAIKFAHISPEEARKMSAVKVITADTYDDDGFPIEMGLMDPHLGVRANRVPSGSTQTPRRSGGRYRVPGQGGDVGPSDEDRCRVGSVETDHNHTAQPTYPCETHIRIE